VAYYLCGKAFAGYTLASTSQLMDMRNGQWSAEIFDRLKLPIEATSSGNILMQAKATGQIESVGQIRRIVGRSFDIKRYEPADRALWSEHYKKVKEEYGCQ
jgi:sugar (pentulose or hexulose) kinase